MDFCRRRRFGKICHTAIFRGYRRGRAGFLPNMPPRMGVFWIRNRFGRRVRTQSEAIGTNWSVSFADFVARCKAKHITMTRICRCVFQVLLGVEKSTERERQLPYIRLLGMRKEAAGCLRRVGDAGETVVVARVARDRERLDAEGRRKLEQDIRASDIYRGTVMAASGKRLPDEYKRRLITI